MAHERVAGNTHEELLLMSALHEMTEFGLLLSEEEPWGGPIDDRMRALSLEEFAHAVALQTVTLLVAAQDAMMPDEYAVWVHNVHTVLRGEKVEEDE